MKKKRMLSGCLLAGFILLMLFTAAGCGKKISEEGRQIVETMVDNADAWESNRIWMMSFSNRDGETVLAARKYGSSSVGGSRQMAWYYYSVTPPIECVGKSESQMTTIFLQNGSGDGFQSCWSTSWPREKKIDYLTKLYIAYEEGK